MHCSVLNICNSAFKLTTGQSSLLDSLILRSFVLTEAFQLCLHRCLMSTGCKSSHSGFLDVSRSNGGLRMSRWIGQLTCLTIFSTILSVTAFLCRAGVSMLESTGSHGRGVERRVPEMYIDSVYQKAAATRAGCYFKLQRDMF